MRILFLTTVLPDKRRNGGEVVSHLLIEQLMNIGHQVSVIGYLPVGENEKVQNNWHSAGHRYIETNRAGFHKYIWVIQSIAKRQAYSVQKYISKEYAATLKSVLQNNQPELVIIDHAQMHWLLDFLPAELPIILCAHNIEHQIYKEASLSNKGFSEMIYLREARFLSKVERRTAF